MTTAELSIALDRHMRLVQVVAADVDAFRRDEEEASEKLEDAQDMMSKLDELEQIRDELNEDRAMVDFIEVLRNLA